MIKVFGHKAPDTDTVGSAILWAWYLNTHTSYDATPHVLGELNKETLFILDRWKVREPELLEHLVEEDRVVIVDTNNPQELPETIHDATIIEIIDHHKLTGGLTTSAPLTVTMKTYASTATIIYDLVEQHVDTMPDSMMGVMLSCILSDTLEFRSPTTTPHDKNVAEKLAEKLGVVITDYANEMFAAKSDMSDYSDMGLITLDSKKFDVGEKNIRISVIETTTPQSILKRKDGIVKAIQSTVADEDGIDEVLFFVIDILNQEATVFTYNEMTKGIISSSFGVDVDSDTEVLPGVVSRKKQIVPVLKIPR